MGKVGQITENIIPPSPGFPRQKELKVHDVLSCAAFQVLMITLSKCLCFCAEDIPCQACPCIGEWFVFLQRNETITCKTKLFSF